MTSRDFCYWLQGVFEVANPATLDAKQVDLIKRHLSLVFIHEIDPLAPPHQQAALNAAHAAPEPEKPAVTVTMKPIGGGGPMFRC